MIAGARAELGCGLKEEGFRLPFLLWNMLLSTAVCVACKPPIQPMHARLSAAGNMSGNMEVRLEGKSTGAAAFSNPELFTERETSPSALMPGWPNLLRPMGTTKSGGGALPQSELGRSELGRSELGRSCLSLPCFSSPHGKAFAVSSNKDTITAATGLHLLIRRLGKGDGRTVSTEGTLAGFCSIKRQ